MMLLAAKGFTTHVVYNTYGCWQYTALKLHTVDAGSCMREAAVPAAAGAAGTHAVTSTAAETEVMHCIT